MSDIFCRFNVDGGFGSFINDYRFVHTVLIANVYIIFVVSLHDFTSSQVKTEVILNGEIPTSRHAHLIKFSIYCVYVLSLIHI